MQILGFHIPGTADPAADDWAQPIPGTDPNHPGNCPPDANVDFSVSHYQPIVIHNPHLGATLHLNEARTGYNIVRYDDGSRPGDEDEDGYFWRYVEEP